MVHLLVSYLLFLTESSKSPASIAKSNKQWVGTCLYQGAVVFWQEGDMNRKEV